MAGGTLKQAKLARIGATAGELFIIANGDQNSNSVPFKEFFGDAEAFTIAAPSTLAETPVMQIDPGDGTFRTVVDASNVAVVLPTAGNIQVYNGIVTAGAYIRLHTGGAVAADRLFLVTKAFRA